MKKKPSKRAWWTDRVVYQLDHVNWHRHPKTQNERRQNQAAVDDGFHVHGKRRRPNLPHSWDDLRYSWHSGKCCKRFTRRKHQYK